MWRARNIDIQPCLDSWLRPVVKASGPVAPWPSNFYPKKILSAAMDKANLEKWPDNGMRHSFATYFLVHFDDPPKLMRLMGHLSLKTTFEHYVTLASKKDAARYWEIKRPTDNTGKVRRNNGVME